MATHQLGLVSTEDHGPKASRSTHRGRCPALEVSLLWAAQLIWLCLESESVFACEEAAVTTAMLFSSATGNPAMGEVLQSVEAESTPRVGSANGLLTSMLAECLATNEASGLGGARSTGPRTSLLKLKASRSPSLDERQRRTVPVPVRVRGRVPSNAGKEIGRRFWPSETLLGAIVEHRIDAGYLFCNPDGHQQP